MAAKRQIKLNKKPKVAKVEEKKEKVKVIEEKDDIAEKIIGDVGETKVVKPKGQIVFEAQVAPVPMFRLPADIRQYLINKGFSSDVYKKDKEWLEKHGADMKMIQRLKDFLISMNK